MITVFIHTADNKPFFGKLLGFVVLAVCLLTVAGYGKEPADAVDSIQRAIQHQDKGELPAAIIELKNALQQNPNNAEVRWLLGKLYVQQGDGSAAQKELERATEAGISYKKVVIPLGQAYLLQQNYQAVLDHILAKDDLTSALRAEVLTLRGQAYQASGKLEEASKEFQEALVQQPGRLEALLGLGWVALQQDQRETAKQWLDKAMAAAPDKTAVWLLQGDYQQRQGDLLAAEAAYTKALALDARNFPTRLGLVAVLLSQKKTDAAGKVLDGIQGQARQHPQIQYYYALLALIKGDYALARDRLQELFKNSPDYPPALYLMGVTQYTLGNLEQANDATQRLLERFPDSAQAKRLKGLIELRRDRPDPSKRQADIDFLLSQFPQDIEVLNAVASSLLAQGQPAEATEHLQKVVELQPQSAGAHAQLGAALLEQGKPEPAIQELEKARELGSQSPQTELLLISSYIAAKEYDRALAALQLWREKEPQNTALWNLTGTAYAGKEQADKAEAAFQKALAIAPGDPGATANLAQLSLSRGDTGKARSYYQQALAKHPDDLRLLLMLVELEWQQGNKEAAVKQLDEAVRKQPHALQPRLARARVYLEENKPTEALRLLREAEEEYGANPDFLLLMGNAQLVAGDADAAIRTFNKLAGLQPDSAVAQYWLAGAYGQKNDLNEMQKLLFKALTLQPDNPLAGPLLVQWLALAPNDQEAGQLLQTLKKQFPKNRQVLLVEGQVALQHGNYKQAANAYQQALALFPDDAVSMHNLAEAYLKVDDHAAYFAAMQAWLEKHPQDKQARFLLANHYLTLKRYAEARTAYAKLLELEPDNPQVLNNFALALQQQNPQQARQYAEKALSLAPDNAAVMDTLGLVLLAQGDTQRALELLRKASQLQPLEREIRYHLAKALVKDGQKDDARQLLRRALADKTAAFESRPEASALLKELGD
jgi:putative PEP-CTERM system TPR-repeat lipoprotein